MLSNTDLFALVTELKIMDGGYILNVYEYAGERLILKLRTKEGKKILLIDPKKRIHLTEFKYPMPKLPTQFCMVLRKYMKGRRVLKVYQHNMDRILIMELKSEDSAPWKFIIELFAGGNYLLLNGENQIFMAKKYKVAKDRKVLAKQDYIFPPPRGTDINNLAEPEFKAAMQGSDTDLVRTIARNFNLGGDFAEEVCAIVGIPKNTPAKDLTAPQLDQVFQALKRIYDQLVKGEFSPAIICTPAGEYDTVVPFQMKNYAGLPAKPFPTFNAAVDEFFGKSDVDAFKDEQETEIRQSLSKYERILSQQQATIAENEEKVKKNQAIGERVYSHLMELDELLATVNKAWKEGNKSWEEIKAALLKGKEMNIPSALLFENFKPAQQEMVINLEGNLISVSLQDSVHQIADHFFSEAKKARRKIEGTQEAMAETEKEISRETKSSERMESKLTGLVRSRKKNWYEKFHWFFTSDQFLVVAGRDASANEILVKRYLEKNDLFFHADVKGAPVCVVKNPDGGPIPDTTISEAATFAGCYSHAWRFGWGDMTIYYVGPDQISKSPPSGEFLPKGSFFVSGKKNIIASTYLKLAIGVQFEVIPKEAEEEEDQFIPYVIGGPESAIKPRTEWYVTIRPQKSGQTSGTLAGKIKETFLHIVPEDKRKWVELLPVDEIVLFIPGGTSSFS